MGIWALYNPKLPIWPLIGLPDLAGDPILIAELRSPVCCFNYGAFQLPVAYTIHAPAHARSCACQCACMRAWGVFVFGKAFCGHGHCAFV
jgi:hypothetical protein